MRRDKEVNLSLLKDGWKILRFRGSDIQKNLQTCITKIEQTINEIKRENKHKRI